MTGFENAFSSYLKNIHHCPKISGAEPPGDTGKLGRERYDPLRLNLATYHKLRPHHVRTRVGVSTIVLGDQEVTLLRKLSARLQRINQARMTVRLDPEAIQLSAPLSCADLQDFGIQLTRGDEQKEGRVSFVGRRQPDGGVVYTESVSVELLLERAHLRHSHAVFPRSKSLHSQSTGCRGS